MKRKALPIFPARRDVRTPRGFSLVEVVLAIGIVSFAMLVIIGLFGGVMKSSSENNERRELAEAIDSLRRTFQTGNFTTTYDAVRNGGKWLYVTYRADTAGDPKADGTNIAAIWTDPATNSRINEYDAARTGRWVRATLRVSPSNPGGTSLPANAADYAHAGLWALATLDTVPVPVTTAATNSGTLETTLSILR